MRKRGVDISDHRSRQLSQAMIDEAGLILAAARMHAWETVALRPSAVGRVFTFHEFVRLANTVGSARSDESIDRWIERVHVERNHADALNRDKDIVDPYGRSRRTYERVAAEIEVIIDRLAELVFPMVPNGTAMTAPSTRRRSSPSTARDDR